MFEKSPACPDTLTLSESRQVRALLRLVEDLGYGVQADPNGQWTIIARDEPTDRTVVGVDSAREVVAAARQLAESLQIDRSPLPAAVH